MDYESFFPITKITIILILILVASVCQWHISQLDVKNVILEWRSSKKKFIWHHLLVFHMTLNIFVSSRKHYIVLNKHLVLSLRSFILWSLLLDLFLVVMIFLFLLSALKQVVSLCFYILMTWLLLVITLMVFQFWRWS